MMAMALALLATGQAAAPRPSTPIPTADALALFKRLCADTAADPARFAAALAREPDAFRKQQILPGPDRGATGRYLSERAEVNFAASDGHVEPWPASLPSRSCGVLGHDIRTVDHSALVAAMTDTLGLPPAGGTREAKPRGDRASATEWNLTRATARIGYSLVTRSSPDGSTLVAIGMRMFRSDR